MVAKGKQEAEALANGMVQRRQRKPQLRPKPGLVVEVMAKVVMAKAPTRIEFARGCICIFIWVAQTIVTKGNGVISSRWVTTAIRSL